MDEIEQLRRVVRDHLARDPGAALRGGPLAPDAARRVDRDRWRRQAGELGLPGVRIPEQYGGAGMGLAEEVAVHTELGRALDDGPFLTTSLVAAALTALTDDEANHDRLARIASGDLIAVPVLPIEETFPLQYPHAKAGPDGDFEVTGELPCVVDATVADAMLVLADYRGFHAFFWVETSDPGVEVDALKTLDLTRRMGAVRLNGARARLLAEQDRARAGVAAIRQGAILGMAAESVGAAERALEMAVEYVKVRTQFGRPIGSFQAVKHKCADLLVSLERARSALSVAVRSVQHNDAVGRRPESLAGLAVARMYCGRAGAEITREAIHLHGGIGFTWEHPAHLYYRRAVSNRQLLDSTGQQPRLLTASVLAAHGEDTQLASFYAGKVGR
ncbi:acyl-CoA/acyl-ACP dehydrogenase [Dactylosporangium vinaceum]|uniref:Acyl-CoA dehydrogenase family protein n=1 Tax=Dactylosporangium vinaceum TaxID=53362 RepID=A0ABV5MFZ1_9ACTN|nr:acyl-CoA dehydrogenase family protein [Dactylosporangium vinaceum]UAB98889.1 acyl-CoA/acyl-ACP dehydrogenase [Dactylosporangium vinaceum]